MIKTFRRAVVGIALVALAGVLALPGTAGASPSTRAVTTTSAAAVVHPDASPCSPGGICDSRLCGGSNFNVVSGALLHEFTLQSVVYITGGLQRRWLEMEYFGPIFWGRYHFSVDCY